ncbi:unnamed protein product [Ixodes pacificus]
MCRGRKKMPTCTVPAAQKHAMNEAREKLTDCGCQTTEKMKKVTQKFDKLCFHSFPPDTKMQDFHHCLNIFEFTHLALGKVFRENRAYRKVFSAQLHYDAEHKLNTCVCKTSILH